MKECKYRMMLKKKDRGCIEHECVHYQDVLGTNPQTGETIKEYMCSDLLQNMLLIENSQMQRQTGAAVESLRNEVVEKHNKLLSDMLNSNYFPHEQFIPGLKNN